MQNCYRGGGVFRLLNTNMTLSHTAIWSYDIASGGSESELSDTFLLGNMMTDLR